MNCQPEYGRYASDAWSLSSDIISGIKSMIGSLADCVTGVADNIREFLHFSVPDKETLTDYENRIVSLQTTSIKVRNTWKRRFPVLPKP